MRRACWATARHVGDEVGPNQQFWSNSLICSIGICRTGNSRTRYHSRSTNQTSRPSAVRRECLCAIAFLDEQSTINYQRRRSTREQQMRYTIVKQGSPIDVTFRGLLDTVL